MADISQLDPKTKKAIAAIRRMSTDERRKVIKEYNPAYFGIENAIENDLKRLQSVGDWSKLDAATYEQVKSYLVFHISMIRTHHHAQGEHFAPKMMKLFPEYNEEISAILVDGHKAIEQQLVALEGLVASNNRADIAAQLKEYAEIFEKHLPEEEQGTLIMRERFDKKKLDEGDAEVLKELATDKHDFRMNLAWIIHGMDDESRRAFFKKLPPPVWVIWKLFLRRGYVKRLRVFEKFQGKVA